MTITLTSDIEQALLEAARRQGKTAEELLEETLRAAFMPPTLLDPFSYEAQDEWEARVLSLATDCGISLPDEAFESDIRDFFTVDDEDVQTIEKYIRDLEEMFRQMRADQQDIDRLREERRAIEAHTDAVMAETSKILARIRESW